MLKFNVIFLLVFYKKNIKKILIKSRKRFASELKNIHDFRIVESKQICNNKAESIIYILLMNFLSALDFFVNVCEKGFYRSCADFSIEEEYGMQNLKDLQNYIGFDLFSWNEIPSVDCLTKSGVSFLGNAKNMMKYLLDGVFEVCNDKIDNNIIIRSNFLDGKSIIFPVIFDIGETNKFSDINIDLVTCESFENYDDINAHVLFHEMSKADKIFFEKRWSVKMNQGLYASEDYLIDVGHYPQKVEDLLMHSILGYGDAFDNEIYKATNWHLSGKYGLCDIEPSIMISSQNVIIAAVEANLGIGPVVNHYDKIGYKKLFRVFPEISSPTLIVDFAVRKKIADNFKDCINEIEEKILEKIKDIGLEVIYNNA